MEKQHYLLLDGLRGVAALMVLWYHVFEGFAFAGGTMIETFNHGHLGVDFFFMLSGFVISYAYDDRWKANGLSIKGFFRRRLVRLQPMVVMGAIIGLITYLLQGGVRWDGTQMPFHWILVAFFLAMFLIPAYPGAPYDVRGNGEMYPLNGPSWSLFFEYIGNVLYALFIRKLSNKGLAFLVVMTGLLWTGFVVFDVSKYDMIGIGWTLDSVNFLGGLLRMLFPFTLGMLLSRNFNSKSQKPTALGCPVTEPVEVTIAFDRLRHHKTTNSFYIAAILMFILFSMPYIPKSGNISINGIYELACIILVFPLIVWFGASGRPTGKISMKACKFLGDISYPLYIVHYPVMYLFYSWLIDKELYTLGETWLMVLLVMATNIAVAYACLKLYDEPVRKWLNNRISKIQNLKNSKVLRF